MHAVPLAAASLLCDTFSVPLCPEHFLALFWRGRDARTHVGRCTFLSRIRQATHRPARSDSGNEKRRVAHERDDRLPPGKALSCCLGNASTTAVRLRWRRRDRTLGPVDGPRRCPNAIRLSHRQLGCAAGPPAWPARFWHCSPDSSWRLCPRRDMPVLPSSLQGGRHRPRVLALRPSPNPSERTHLPEGPS